MLICVDFDGTIVEHRFPAIGQPAPGAIDWLRRWQEGGALLILWTVRSGEHLDVAAAYVRGEGVHLHGVNSSPGQSGWSQSPKAYARLYVDDAAFGCPLIRPEGFARPCVDWRVVGPAVMAELQRNGAGEA